MKILFAGQFDPGYNRTKVIMDGLAYGDKIEVLQYNFNIQSKWNWSKLASACKDADVIFLPSFTHLDVPLIKTLSRKPLIFDPLISRYLTKVFDYKKVRRHSPRAYKNFLKDKISMSMSDVVLCDTEMHKKYFHKAIGIAEDKLKLLPVGVNTDEFYPLPQKQNPVFTVGFYGSFIPLHGTRIIVEAAKILRDHPVRFEMIGSGFEYEQIKNLALNTYRLDNIDFRGWVSYQELPACLNSFDITLGIFGDTLKTDLVVPNKIFHYAAVKKAIITKRTPAIEEIFEDKISILLCHNTPEDLADKIVFLLNDPEKRNAIATTGYNLATKHYNHKIIAERLLKIADELLTPKNRP